jgi:hypothetical protein
MGRGEAPAGSGANASGGGGRSSLSAIMGALQGDFPRMNCSGDSHCYICRATDHLAYKYPQLSGNQQQQLHMNLEARQEQIDKGQSAPTAQGDIRAGGGIISQ